MSGVSLAESKCPEPGVVGGGGGGEVAGTSRRKLASADPGSPLSTDCVSK